MRSNRESNRTSNGPDNCPSNLRNNGPGNGRSNLEDYRQSSLGRSFPINPARNLGDYLGDDGGEFQKGRIKGCI